MYGELNDRGDCDFSEKKEYHPFMSEVGGQTFLDHYQQLAENHKIKLLGEFSPTNAYASIDQLYWFKEEAQKRNLNILPVMTLRDPISWIVSATKFLNKQSNITFATIAQQMDNIPYAEKELTWRQTYNNYLEVFGKIYINLFETLFTDDSMKKLCDYLEIPMSNFKYNLIRNKHGENIILTEDQKRFVFERSKNYQANYDFAADIFGKELLEHLWWNSNK